MYASLLTDIPFTITAHANDIFERGCLLKEKGDRARKILTISWYNVDYLKATGNRSKQTHGCAMWSKSVKVAGQSISNRELVK